MLTMFSHDMHAHAKNVPLLSTNQLTYAFKDDSNAAFDMQAAGIPVGLVETGISASINDRPANPV